MHYIERHAERKFLRIWAVF